MRVSAIAAAFLLLGAPGTAFGHGGGLDANGCHTNRKTGEYHCHRAPAAPAPSAPAYRRPAPPKSNPSTRPSSATGISSAGGVGTIEVGGGGGAATQRELTLAAQALLKALGYYTGGLDGVPGGNTANAIYRFQRDAGVTQERPGQRAPAGGSFEAGPNEKRRLTETASRRLVRVGGVDFVFNAPAVAAHAVG